MNCTNIIRRVLVLVIVLFCIYWCARIWSINQNIKQPKIYECGQTIDCGDLSICVTDSFLITQDQFENRFDLPEGVVDYSYEAKIIGVCLCVTNTSNEVIAWSDIMAFIRGGFESSTWMSSVEPLFGQRINRFSSEVLNAGESQDVWFSVDVQKGAFKDLTWKNIDEVQFFYVLSLYPNKAMIRLNT